MSDNAHPYATQTSRKTRARTTGHAPSEEPASWAPRQQTGPTAIQATTAPMAQRRQTRFLVPRGTFQTAPISLTRTSATLALSVSTVGAEGRWNQMGLVLRVITVP